MAFLCPSFFFFFNMSVAMQPSQDSPKDSPTYNFLPRLISGVVHCKVGNMLPRMTMYYTRLRNFPNFK